jgi:Tfp pilus assembly protein PilZ
MATVMIAGVAIGIGIDYSIHFSSRFREELRKQPDELFALDKALETTGRAILVNALAVGLGFSVLIAANLVPIQRFGWMIALTMLLSATSALTFLPAMILILKRFLFDQRRAPRVNMPMQARLQEHNAVQYPVANVSLGGICVQSYEALSIGERFHLELQLPNNETITCPVRVVWQCRLSFDTEESQYEVGLRFTNLTDDASSQLETMLEKYAE